MPGSVIHPLAGHMSLATRRLLVNTLFATFTFLASAAAAQSPSSGAVTGVVADSLGLPLQGIDLTLRSSRSGTSRSATTTREGTFRFALLLPGEYELRAEGFGFHPRWITGVRIHAERELHVPIELTATEPTAARLDSLVYTAGASAGSAAGRGLLISRSAITAFPDRSRDISELASLSSSVGDGLSMEGLPGSMTQLRLDGNTSAGGAFYVGSSSPLRGMSVARIGLEAAEVVTAGSDVEWGGAAAGVVNAISVSGTRDFSARAFGAWSQSSVDPAVLAADELDTDGLRGGFLLTGPIARDTSAFALGVELSRAPAILHPARGVDSLAAGFGSIAQEQYETALPESWVRSLEPQVVSAFGRLEWRLSDEHQLRVGVNAGTTTDVSGGILPDRSPYGIAAEGEELGAFVNLASRFGETLWHELRAGFTRAGRDYAANDFAAFDPPATLLATSEIAVGDFPGLPRSTQQTDLRLSSALHLWRGSHRFKVGAEFTHSAFESTFDDGGADRFLFAGLEGFEAGEGMFVGVPGSALGGSFSVPVISLFAQDRWSPLHDVELLLGVRYDRESLPSADIQFNEDWFVRSGLDNRDAPESVSGLSPRAALTWDVGQRHEWVVRASAGSYLGRLAPELVADPLALDAGVQVTRGVGDMISWPDAPGADIAPVLGTRLAMLDPGAKAPRTNRGSVGVSRYLGGGTSLHLTGTLRRTDFLPRRSDLNLLPEAIYQDQYSRPIYGEPQLVGGLLTATGASNRRFIDFERVDVTNTDGWSEYRGVTAIVESAATRWLTLLGSYTVSSTEDNWSTRFPLEGSVDPFPGDSALAGWAEGTSDLDVPHRAVLGAELGLPSFPAVRLAGLYRFRSGLPFTPSFHPSLDANVDGFGGNDPAYVDAAVEGLSALMGDWPCLRDGQGGFADRNSCRSDAAHSLDLRLTLRLGAADGLSGELFADALGLLRTGEGDFPDPVLYLLDPAGVLESDPGAATVTVPLIANPNFGRPLAGTAPGATLRFGVRIHY
jgi:hypothetical protein